MKSFTHGILFLYCLTSFAEPARASHKTDADLLITKESFLPGHRKNTLSKLQDDDSISISFQSYGCFHATASKILINKQDGKYYASLYNVKLEYATANSFTTMVPRVDSILKTVALTKVNIDDFIRFERGLGVVRDDGCTTIDSYQFRSKYRNLDRTDGSCSWGGFNFLRKSFFGSSE